jgi:hypothetical protein
VQRAMEALLAQETYLWQERDWIARGRPALEAPKPQGVVEAPEKRIVIAH